MVGALRLDDNLVQGLLAQLSRIAVPLHRLDKQIAGRDITLYI